MIRYVLNKDEFKDIIETKLLGKQPNIDSTSFLLNDSESYTRDLVGLDYFFSKILETFLKKGIDCKSILHDVYDFENCISFILFSFDNNAIDSLFSYHLPNNRNMILDELKSEFNEETKEKLIEKLNLALEDDLLDFVNNYKF